MSEVYIYDTLRTPFGKGNNSGALFEIRPIDLLSKCLKSLEQRNQLNTSLVGDLILGCMIPVDGQADNIARTALLHAGWSECVAGIQINRYQAAGLSAIAIAAAKIKAGWESVVVSGGLESISRIQRSTNRGPLSSDPDVISRIGSVPTGIAADFIATREEFTKQQLDEFAFQSIEKARHAFQNEWYHKSLIPIYDQNRISVLQEDETIDMTSTIEEFAAEKPIFPRHGRHGFETTILQKYPLIERIIPTHSSKTVASLADCAGLVLLGNKLLEKTSGLKARARIVSSATIGTELTITHLGAISATRKLLQKNKLKPAEIDLWYTNESYAAPAMLFKSTFNVSDKKFNPFGGNIAFGDPPGANGTVLLGMLLDELERQNLKKGLIAINAEGGIGVCMLIEVC